MLCPRSILSFLLTGSPRRSVFSTTRRRSLRRLGALRSASALGGWAARTGPERGSVGDLTSQRSTGGIYELVLRWPAAGRTLAADLPVFVRAAGGGPHARVNLRDGGGVCGASASTVSAPGRSRDHDMGGHAIADAVSWSASARCRRRDGTLCAPGRQRRESRHSRRAVGDAPEGGRRARGGRHGVCPRGIVRGRRGSAQNRERPPLHLVPRRPGRDARRLGRGGARLRPVGERVDPHRGVQRRGERGKRHPPRGVCARYRDSGLRARRQRRGQPVEARD